MLRNAIILFCMLTYSGPALAEADRFSRIAEQLVAAINADDQAKIQSLFNPVMQQAVPEDKARAFFGEILKAGGKIKKFEKLRATGETTVYRLICEQSSWNMQMTLDEKDLIAGLYITPGAPVPSTSEVARNSVPMRLPFREKWTVFWGGDSPEQNQHVAATNQRRALDLVICDANGKTHSGNRNEDYYCYGKEVLAPADGKVVTVIDGVPDNAPDSMNPYSALGNCVILRHADREYSVLAHLKPHSIRVKEGDLVKAQSIIGLCGNSGNSSEPHLHFHLQDSAVIQDGLGIKPYFLDVLLIRNGKTTSEKECSPVRNDVIQPKRPTE